MAVPTKEPSARKKSLTKTRPRIAILVDTSTSWGRRVILGIGNYARQYGPWQTFLEARGMEEHLRIASGWQGDGIIARVSTPAIAQELKALKIPVVNVSGIRVQNADFPTVTTDPKLVTEMALSHFRNRGFRNFGYFNLRGLSYVAAQKDAFVNTVKSIGGECALYEVKVKTRAEPDWSLDLAELGKWLKSLPRPVGILAWNASSGREILYACEAAGLIVPEEVAVLSATDDDVLCECLQTPLSGIVVDAEKIGNQAAALMDGLLHGKRAPKEPIRIAPLDVATRRSTETLAISDPALRKALAFLGNNASAPMQVTDVARECGLSRRVLERKFIQVLGRTPADEIRRFHLDRARHLLIQTTLSIPDVAEASGFASPEYFAYVFKAECGKTPLEYRRRLKG